MGGGKRGAWSVVGVVALLLAAALVWSSRTDGARGGVERGAAPADVRPPGPVLREAPLREADDDGATRETARAAAADEHDGDPTVAPADLLCRIREPDASLSPLAAGALVVRSGGALRLVAVTDGTASVAGLSADARVVGAREGDHELVVLEAPPEPARGGVVVVAFPEGHVLHVRDARTQRDLEGLRIHVLADRSSEGELEMGGVAFGDPLLRLLPDRTRVIAAGASPLDLGGDTRGHCWIESPTHGVQRVWIDPSAAETHALMLATGAIEVTVPEAVRRPEYENAGSYRAGYHVALEPPVIPSWCITDVAVERRGGIEAGAYEAWLVPRAADEPRAPVAHARFDVLVGQTTRVEFRVLTPEERGGGTLRIVVLDGDRSVGAEVVVQPLDGRPRSTQSSSIDARRFAQVDGRRHVVELADVRSGRWLVGDAMSRARTEVVVPRGGTAEAVLDLGSARRVDVEVVGGSQPLGLGITDDRAPRLRGRSMSVRDGKAVLHLVPGPVNVRAHDYRASASAVVDSAHTATLRLELASTAERPEYALELWHAGRRVRGLDWRWVALEDPTGEAVNGPWMFPTTDPSVARVRLAPGEHTLRTRDGSGQLLARFVADPAHPVVLVELDAAAPLDALLMR